MADITYQKPSYSEVPAIANIDLCSGVPLDTSYQNTLTFSNAEQQYQYFIGKRKKHFPNLSPISVGKPVRLPVVADAIFDCNYIILTNSNFSVKHFYCFITKITYVNLNCCEIEYVIDVMQTWYFQMIIQPCMVLRHHVNDDTIGSNTLAENIPLGEYKRFARTKANATSNVGVMVTLPAEPTAKNYNQLTAGIFSGLTQYVFEENNGSVAPIGDTIQRYVNSGEENKIIAIQMVPMDYVTERGEKNPKTKKVSVSKPNGTLDGYTPKNNKLKQYPYMYLEVDNTQGQTGIYKFEYFNSENCEFEIVGVTSGDSPEIVSYPLNYNGMGKNVMEHITLSGFPMCAWTGDTYKAYVANNAMKTAQAIGSTAITGLTAAGIQGLTGHATGAFMTGFNTVMNIGNQVGSYMQEGNNAKIEGNRIRGTRGSNALFSSKLMDFWFTVMTIDASHAKAADAYLTRFGYRIDKIEKPNITGRKSFNYVQTLGSSVRGYIPFDDLAKINSIFDAGITFWHGDFVGDYGRDNSIGGVIWQ